MIDYVFHLVVLVCIYSLVAIGLNLLLGYSKLLNLGIAAVFGVGAYSSALLTLANVPFVLSLFCGVLIGGVFSVIIGLFSLRLKGEYFALVTLGFVVLFDSFVRNVSLTNGSAGLSNIVRPNIFSLVISLPWEFAIASIIILLVVLIIVYRLVSSPFGRLLKGVRDDEIASRAIGKFVLRTRLVVLFISGIIIALAGVWYVHYVSFISPSSFGLVETFLVLSMVIVGGLESFSGSVLGVFILVLFSEFLRFVNLPVEFAGALHGIIFSLILILIIMYRPKGLFGSDVV